MRWLALFMLKTLLLLLPVLVPSWRFFEEIEPSPRVEWTLLPNRDTLPNKWYEFRPRALKTSPFQMLRCLFWNPEWNETLFVVSCAERIAQHPTNHSIKEINQRILADLDRMNFGTRDMLMQFRLVFVQQGQTGLTREEVFLSHPIPADGPEA